VSNQSYRRIASAITRARRSREWGIGDSGSLRWVGQEAAFDQDRGQSIVSQNPIATVPNAAINAGHRLDHPRMDQSSQAVPALVIVVGLDSIGAFPSTRI
jgi:hypothetical protein